MVVLVFKIISQLLLLAGGILSLWKESYIIKDGKKRPSTVGWITIAALSSGFIIFLVTEIKDQNKNRQEISFLRQLTLNRDLSEIEISFKPSAEHWSKITEAYKYTNPTPANMTVSYKDAPMTAERNGDYWKIEFDEIKPSGGVITFNPVATNKPNGKGFENVIREAAIGLWIKCADSAPIKIEPKRGDYYPSAIKVSQERITFILRPPILKWNLNNLHDNPIIILRGDNYPSNLSVRSTGSDDIVKFEQTFNLNWTEKNDGSFEAQMLPTISGPYHLNPKFKFDPT